MQKKLLKAFFKHPRIIIAVCILVTLFFAFFMKDLALENALRSFYPQKDASFDRLNETEDVFGSMVSIGIVLETKNGTSILTPEYIDTVRHISERSLEIAEVEDVDSVTDIDFVCDEEGTISATQLIPESYTGSDEDIAQLKSRLIEWQAMYDSVIVKDDFTGFQIQISLRPKNYETLELEEAEATLKELIAQRLGGSSDPDLKEKITQAKADVKEKKAVIRKVGTDIMRQEKALAQVRQIVAEEVDASKLNVTLVGEPVLSNQTRLYVLSDLARLVPLVVIVVLLSLAFSFKTLQGTLLPLCTVLMATAISVGMMGFLKVTFTLVSSVIPVALIAVGSAYGIHVLTHYYIALEAVQGELTREKYEDCVFESLDEVKLAVILAGITTVAGFISLVTSPLGPLHNFAIFSAVGVAVSLVLSVTFIPAVLLLNDYTKAGGKSSFLARLMSRVSAKLERGHLARKGQDGDFLYSVYSFFCGSAARLGFTVLLIVVVSIFGLRLLNVETAMINYFPKTSEFRQDINYVDENYAGTNALFFTIEGQERGDISNPELLKAVDEMESYLTSRHANIGKMVSMATFIKRINQVWHAPSSSAEAADTSGSEWDEASWEGSGDTGDAGTALDDWADWSFDEASDIAADEWSSWGFDEDVAASGSDEADDWADWGFDEDSGEATSGAGGAAYTDPNEGYTAALGSTMTVKELLTLLGEAYISAGGKTATVEDLVDEIMRRVNYNGRAYYEVPYDPAKYPVATRAELKAVVENYLTLLSGSLDRFIDDDLTPKTMRVTCQLKSHSSKQTSTIIADAKAYAAEHFPAGYTLEATGSAQMEHRMTEMIVSSQLMSLLISLASVFVIIAVSFKSPAAGVVGAVPLALCILLNYMMMGFCRINLDFLTSIIASVAVGVGIDYTIHFMTTYRGERRKSDDLVQVSRNTFKKSGRGILTNAVSVGLGFLVLTLSKFIVLRYIGILVAIVMFTSSFLAMTVIPGILNVVGSKSS